MTASSQQLRFRQRNRAYYDDLERLHRLLVPTGQRVLEIGCGLGDLLASLQPSHGVGIELNPELVAAAQCRHPQLRILAADAEAICPYCSTLYRHNPKLGLTEWLDSLGDFYLLGKFEILVNHSLFGSCRLLIKIHNLLQVLLVVRRRRHCLAR
mgnify:CR=1 FL=1